MLPMLSKDGRQAMLRKMWTEDILPNWSTQRYSSRISKIVWWGIPTSLRETVWRLLIGNDLKITADLFAIMKERALKLPFADTDDSGSDTESEKVDSLWSSSASKEDTVRLIRTDLPRTFPDLKFFHEEGVYSQALKDVLRTYVSYRPDVGYVQGMSYVAAMLLLNLPAPEDAFIAFANLVNSELYFTLYRMDISTVNRHLNVFAQLFESELPRTYKRFQELGIRSDMYMYDWMITIFSRALPLDVATRIWDNFLFFGQSFIFRTALGLIRMHQDIFLREDFEVAVRILNRPPTVDEDSLFESIEKIKFSEKLYETLTEKSLYS